MPGWIRCQLDLIPGGFDSWMELMPGGFDTPAGKLVTSKPTQIEAEFTRKIKVLNSRALQTSNLSSFFQLVDVSEWSKSDNGSNVRLIFDQHWRPGVTVSSLIIQRVNKSHNGIFQCIPSNSEAKEIKVHVLKGNVK